MRGCRKIYNNLLLMSVMLFSLSGIVHPWLHAGCGHDGCVFAHHGGEEAFQTASYQNGRTFSGYARLSLCGPVCGDTVLVLPDCAPVFTALFSAENYGKLESRSARARFMPLRDSRGPPEPGGVRGSKAFVKV